mmetsp:Transcript_10414/g.10450  ORF Transcript_10414/g.10450 Transcript_10414/m.10450 type:complete len:90 (-) Transcript_10414:1499-1768(-)
MQTKTVQATNGNLMFDDAIIVGQPGSQVLLYLSTDAINPTKIEKAFPALGSVKTMYLQGYLRLCGRAEYQSTDLKCLICADRFFNLAIN